MLSQPSPLPRHEATSLAGFVFCPFTLLSKRSLAATSTGESEKHWSKQKGNTAGAGAHGCGRGRERDQGQPFSAATRSLAQPCWLICTQESIYHRVRNLNVRNTVSDPSPPEGRCLERSQATRRRQTLQTLPGCVLVNRYIRVCATPLSSQPSARLQNSLGKRRRCSELQGCANPMPCSPGISTATDEARGSCQRNPPTPAVLAQPARARLAACLPARTAAEAWPWTQATQAPARPLPQERKG